MGSAAFSPVTLAMTSVIETAFNAALSRDPGTRQRMQSLAGKVIHLRLTGIDRSLYIIPGHRCLVLSTCEAQPDVTITGTPLAFMRMQLARRREDSLFAGDVTIDGDTATGHAFQNILAQLDLDWEEQLSRLTGDVLAHQVGNLARGLGRWGRHVAETLLEDTGDWLQEESRLVPCAIEIEHFVNAVDTLRADTARLEARIRRLCRRAGVESCA